VAGLIKHVAFRKKLGHIMNLNQETSNKALSQDARSATVNDQKMQISFLGSLVDQTFDSV
jgi:hypothetical protein